MKRLTRVDECGDIYASDKYKDMDCDDWYYIALKKLVRYEKLEESGKLIELPCSVGDIVWCTTSDQYDYISEPIECLVNEISSNIDNKNIIIFRIDSISSTDGWTYAFPNVTISNHMNIRHIEDFGKSVFLTREEAELKLKEMIK